MGKCVRYECIQQLMEIYVHSQKQYAYAAVTSISPLMRVFFEERTRERLDFIDEIQSGIEAGHTASYLGSTFQQLYELNTELYGRDELNSLQTTDIDAFPMDENALEICDRLLTKDLPPNLLLLVGKHAIKIELSILSMILLKALLED